MIVYFALSFSPPPCEEPPLEEELLEEELPLEEFPLPEDELFPEDEPLEELLLEELCEVELLSEDSLLLVEPFPDDCELDVDSLWESPPNGFKIDGKLKCNVVQLLSNIIINPADRILRPFFM